MRRRYGSLLLAIVVACGGAQVAETTSPSSTSTTAVTTTVPPTTTTTLGVEELVDAFVGRITDLEFMAAADLVMEIDFGGLTFYAEGRSLFHGDDYHTMIEIAGLENQETIRVGGIEYQRVDAGPWVTDATGSGLKSPTSEKGPDLNLIAFLKTLGELEHQSTVEEEGMTLHRIGLPPGTPVDPAAFGYAPDEPVEVEVTFLARDDASPHRFEFLIVDSGDPDGVFTTRLDMIFVEPSDPIDISAPEDVWLSHRSEDLGYAIAHPRGWEVEEYRGAEFPTGDFFIGLDGTELDVYRSDLDGEEAVSLNGMVNDFRALVTADGLEAGEPEEIEIAGLPGRLLVYGGDDGAGGMVLGIYAVTQASPNALFEFLLFSDGSDPEGSSRLIFDFLSTFEVEE